MDFIWFIVLIVVVGLISGLASKSNVPPVKKENQPNFKQPKKSGYKKRLLELKVFCNLENIVFLDTETTGISKTDQVIELAIVNTAGEVLVDTLVKPKIKINPKATAVHGIKNSDLKNAPSWPEVYKQYLSATEGKTILAYNSKYDKRLIQQTCKAHQITNKRRQWDCVMMAYSKFMGYIKYDSYTWHKLEVASNNCGITVDNKVSQQHRAVYDAGMTAGVFLYMKRETDLHCPD